MMTDSHEKTDYQTIHGDIQQTGKTLIANRQPVDRWSPVEFIAVVKQWLRQRPIEQRHEAHRAEHVTREAMFFSNNQH